MEIDFILDDAYEFGVNSFAPLIREMPDVTFLLCGRLQEKLSFPGNAKFLGRIPHEKMPNFYSSVDLLALPSYTEGFPNVILEAYACETPVLVTPEASPEELRLYGYKGKAGLFL